MGIQLLWSLRIFSPLFCPADSSLSFNTRAWVVVAGFLSSPTQEYYDCFIFPEFSPRRERKRGMIE